MAPEVIGVGRTTGQSEKWRRRVTIIVVVLPFLAFLIGMAYLWNGGAGGMDVLLLGGMYVLTLLGVEGGFHRLIAHSAFQATTTVRTLLVILGSMASQGPVLFWAATHRRHHIYTDRTGDPHSPHAPSPGLWRALRGFWHAHTGWLFASETTDFSYYTPDLMKDPFLFKLNLLYPLWVLLGLLIPSAIGGMYAQSWSGALSGLLWGGLVRIFLVHHAVWSVNSVCHLFGSRPFHIKGTSTNNIWLSLTSLGGSWHNNHHAFPRTADNAFQWWQIDLCGRAIRVLEHWGLAWNVWSPTQDMIESRTDRARARRSD